MRPFTIQHATDPQAAAIAAQSGAVSNPPPTASPAQFIAGGTTMVDLMALDTMQPQTLVDVNGLDQAYGKIEATAQGLRLGALARMSALEASADVRRDYPVIAQTMALAASSQIRNMASLGGNVLQRTRCEYFRDSANWNECNKRVPGSGCAALQGVQRKHAVLGVSDKCIASYAGDFAQALVALDATVETMGPGGGRRIRFEDLHTGSDDPHRETILSPGELITGFNVPAGPWTRRSVYVKVRDRDSYAYGVATAAVALHMDGDVVQEARIGLGAVSYKPWRAHEAEAALKGKPLTEDAAKAAAKVAFADARPREGNQFAPELGQRTLVRALMQAKALEI